jgi:hypothetical protein
VIPFKSPLVERVFAGYPPAIRKRMLSLRALIFETAAQIEGVGEIEETLKWGEPAYLTSISGSGSTIRIDWKKKRPAQYAMYFNCQTTLIETFRTLFPNDFRFESNRALIFDDTKVLPKDTVAFCIAAALTYHRTSKSAANGTPKKSR